MPAVDIGRPYIIRERDYISYGHLYGNKVILIPQKISPTFIFCDVYWRGDINPFEPYLKNERLYPHHLKPLEGPVNDDLSKYLLVRWRLNN